MNILETNSILLKLCPIPTVIQDAILNILVGYGTPSANAIKSGRLLDDIELPIKVIAMGTLDRCRHTLYYMERTITHYYDNSTHFSKEALIELHQIYLTNKRTTPYTITKLQDVSNYLYKLRMDRLIQLKIEESRIKQV